MTFLVSPSFFKQKVRQLKKTKSISLNEAYNEVAVQFGFTNYKNYLNVLKENAQKISFTREDLFKNVFLESSLAKKETLAISYIHNFNPSYIELFRILKEFKDSADSIQSVAVQTGLQNDIQRSLLDYFIACKEDVQALPLMNGFQAKYVSIRSLAYKWIVDELIVTGKYHLEFEFEEKIAKESKHLPHFRRDPMFGEFLAQIDSTSKISFENPTIGDEIDGKLYVSKFKLK